MGTVEYKPVRSGEYLGTSSPLETIPSPLQLCPFSEVSELP